jgi:hypothetical protein
MRSYRKCYRSEDFKTVTLNPPPGLTVSNAGTNAGPGQVAKMFFRVESLFGGKPFYALSSYNEMAAAPSIKFIDDSVDPFDCTTWVILQSFGGLQFANRVFDLQFFADHPVN